MARLPKGQDFSVYSSPNFKFWFDEKYYTVQGAQTMFSLGTKDDISTMRSEYTRMRDTAQKRIKRLGEKFPESKTYQEHKGGFPKLRDIDPRDFPKAFSELAKFLKAKASTVTGQQQIKEKTIQTFNDNGLKVDNSNYNAVIDVIEEMRRQKIVYDSNRAVEMADLLVGLDDQKKNDILDNLEKLLPHVDELKELPSLAGFDIDELLNLLGEGEEEE